MIVTEGEPASPSKSTFAPVTARTGEMSAQQPPAYSDYQTPYPTANVYPTAAHPIEMGEPAGRRFIKAFCIAVAVWGLSAILLESIVDVARHGRPGRWGSPGTIGWPEARDGKIHRCAEGGGWDFDGNLSVANFSTSTRMPPYHDRTSFTLPVSSDVLYFLSRGALSHGSFRIEPSREDISDVAVDVIVSYWTQEALDRASVCLLERREGQNGVGIFTPNRWIGGSYKDQLQFDVIVRLPTQANASPLEIKELQTEFSNFWHRIENLDGLARFRSLQLKTTNGFIYANNTQVDDAEMHTTNAAIIGTIKSTNLLALESSNGPISGSYESSNKLHLITSNARIDAEVTLSNANGRTPTELLLRTSNGQIDSPVNLRSETKKPAYKVTAATSNNRLNIRFPEQPNESQLHFDARTSNSPAIVSLHPAYEGTFNLQSSNLRPNVEQREVPDPSGNGRQRNVNIRSIVGSTVEGKVWWGNRQKDNSYVRVRTSNSPAILKL